MHSFKTQLLLFVFTLGLVNNFSMAGEFINSKQSYTLSGERGFVWLRKPIPVFPKAAIYDPGCGYVDLKYNISRDERIYKVSIVDSSDRKFERNAVQALKDAKVQFVDPELRSDGLKDLPIRISFENEIMCGGKYVLDFVNRPDDLSTEVSHCLLFLLEPLTEKKYDIEPTGVNTRGVSRTTVSAGLKVKLKNRCEFSVRASTCYNYPASRKRDKSKCKKDMLLKPKKTKNIGKLLGLAASGFSYSSKACVAKGRKDDFFEPKLISEFAISNERQAKKVTGYCVVE